MLAGTCLLLPKRSLERKNQNLVLLKIYNYEPGVTLLTKTEPLAKNAQVKFKHQHYLVYRTDLEHRDCYPALPITSFVLYFSWDRGFSLPLVRNYHTVRAVAGGGYTGSQPLAWPPPPKPGTHVPPFGPTHICIWAQKMQEKHHAVQSTRVT